MGIYDIYLFWFLYLFFDLCLLFEDLNLRWAKFSSQKICF